MFFAELGGFHRIIFQLVACLLTLSAFGSEDRGKHWSFVSPKFHSVPEVKTEGWTKNEIDNYIIAIKEQEIPTDHHSVDLKMRESKSDYLSKIRKIKKHIQSGDIYELNYCQELYAEKTVIDPRSVFARLNKRSKAPFSVFFRSNDLYESHV